MPGLEKANRLMRTNVEEMMVDFGVGAPSGNLKGRSVIEEVGSFFNRVVTLFFTGFWDVEKQAAATINNEVESLEDLDKNMLMLITGNNHIKRNSIVDILDFRAMHKAARTRLGRLSKALEAIKSTHGTFPILERVQKSIERYSYQLDISVDHDKDLLRYHSVDPEKLMKS